MRILILEDDPYIAFDLQEILEGEGHEVVGAYDSLTDAYEHLDDRFDCALLDIDVIGGKSFGLALELLQRNIPFVFVSASRPAELPRRLEQASFVAKPFEDGMILRSIERLASRPLTQH